MDFDKESSSNMALLDGILTSFQIVNDGDLIPILQQIQKEYGYLPPDVLLEVSKKTGIPASRIYGVVTFYEQFHLEPHGRHTIRCCRGTACHVKGGHNMIRTITKTLDIDEGQTTEDMKFTFETVACLGTCFLAPAMMVNNDYYGHLNANKVKSILERYT
jgi:NADH:ubiquinone oxidoreductase subunit E